MVTYSVSLHAFSKNTAKVMDCSQ